MLIPTIVLAMASLCNVMGFPNGAPDIACKNMVPGHLPTGTSGTNPFMFNISATTYKPGDEISGNP